MTTSYPRAGRVIPAALCLAILIVSACVDQDAPNIRTGSEAAMTGPGQLSLTRGTRDSLRREFKWIGDAHNRGLDQLRDRLRAGRPPGNLCRYLAEFATNPARLPRDKEALATDLRARRQDAERAISTIGPCKPTAGEVAYRATPLTAVPFAPVEVSALAISVAHEMEVAVESAETPAALAAALSGLLEQAASLSTEERDALFAIASVAQSSYEYWMSELSRIVEDIGDAYGECASHYRDSGYSSEEAQQRCFGLDYRQTRQETRPPSGPPARHATAAAPRCTDGGANLGKQFRSVGRTDTKGATQGAFLGMAGGPKGIIAGAIGGALGVSAAEAIGYAWDAWWCLMQ